MEVSHFPSIFKLGTVNPIWKSGSKSVMGNYRPISTIHRLGKIFEKALASRIYDFVIKSNIITDNQFGFMTKRSTAQATFQLVNHIIPSVSQGKLVASVLVDFSKAFDCVEVELLLVKLHKYGIRGQAYDLIRSYMDGRTQRVKLKTKVAGIDVNVFSDVISVNNAIAQGSSLGPLLYLLFSNDLAKLFKYCSLTLYADDLSLTCEADTLGDLEHKLNHDLGNLDDWCRCSRLLVNKLQTKYIIFNHCNPNCIQLKLDGCVLEKVTEAKYLGVVIDSRLKYAAHVEMLTTKLSQINGAVYRAVGSFDFHAAILFYNSFVYSLINYGIETWGGRLMTYKCNEFNNAVDRVTKNLFRFFLKTDDVGEIRRKLNLMTPVTIYKFRLCLLYYKISILKFLPQVLFQTRDVNYSLRGCTDLTVPIPKNNTTKINFTYYVPLLWNSLPEEIKSVPLLSEFEYRLKKHLLSNQLN